MSNKPFRKPARTEPVPISFKPLRKLLIDRGLTLTDLHREGLFGTSAIGSLKNDRPVSLDKIALICRHLDVPIEEVVEVIRDEERP